MPEGKQLEQLRCKLMTVAVDGKRGEARKTGMGDRLDVKDEGKGRV